MEPAPTQPSTDARAPEGVGSTIGSFTLLQLLGEGGMGEVWDAEQREPIRRRVALKLLKAGLDTKVFLARFEVERQALAVMDHPSIARVLEAGANPAGRPYYVMELVRGLPITDYCDVHRLTTRQRLEVFAVVCSAVQHAHQKGIIHRDLKPSNVLVTQVDDRPVPKIIDFGIAKAMGAQFTNLTFVTEIGRPIGTPAYMSPEQWDGGQADIDTRSDVYSLGVMLYELLVGRLPTEPNQLLRAGMAIAQLLRDTTPPAPSTRAGNVDDETIPLAKARGTDPRTLVRQLKGDLDWITLKAMDADRGRRYDTAHAMAQDIGRYLHVEPVQARPPSVRYRTGRFVRRNRLGVALVSSAALAGFAFTGLTVFQSRQLATERDRARAEAQRAGALNDFLQQTLLSPDPIDGLGRQTTMLEVLDSASARLGRERPRVPLVAASMESAIGWAYFKLGLFDRAEPLLRRALEIREHQPGVDSMELAESLVQAGALHEARAQTDSAALRYSAALALIRGGGDRDARDLAATLLKAARLFNGRGDTAAAQRALGEARNIFGRSNDSAGMVTVDDHLSTLAYERADYAQAALLQRRVLAYRRGHMGDHPLVASTLQNLGATLEKLLQPAAAESAYRDALRLAESTLGPEHELVSAISNNLGTLLGDHQRYAEGEVFMRRALAIDERTFGRNHPYAGIDLVNLAALLCRSRKAEEGEAMARRAVRIFSRAEGALPWQPAVAGTALGTCLTARRRFVEAEGELIAGLQVITAALGSTHWRADTTRVRLRDLYRAWGKPQKADSVTTSR